MGLSTSSERFTNGVPKESQFYFLSFHFLLYTPHFSFPPPFVTNTSTHVTETIDPIWCDAGPWYLGKGVLVNSAYEELTKEIYLNPAYQRPRIRI